MGVGEAITVAATEVDTSQRQAKKERRKKGTEVATIPASQQGKLFF